MRAVNGPKIAFDVAVLTIHTTSHIDGASPVLACDIFCICALLTLNERPGFCSDGRLPRFPSSSLELELRKIAIASVGTALSSSFWPLP